MKGLILYGILVVVVLITATLLGLNAGFDMGHQVGFIDAVNQCEVVIQELQH